MSVSVQVDGGIARINEEFDGMHLGENEVMEMSEEKKNKVVKLQLSADEDNWDLVGRKGKLVRKQSEQHMGRAGKFPFGSSAGRRQETQNPRTHINNDRSATSHEVCSWILLYIV